ncbi:MAG: hypothetical protein ACFFCS_25540, partial [Candidatus Hodarchaeota archaeon]
MDFRDDARFDESIEYQEEYMSKEQWKASDELVRLFQTVGRASLLYDIQDSHCGNMVMRWRDER